MTCCQYTSSSAVAPLDHARLVSLCSSFAGVFDCSAVLRRHVFLELGPWRRRHRHSHITNERGFRSSGVIVRWPQACSTAARSPLVARLRQARARAAAAPPSPPTAARRQHPHPAVASRLPEPPAAVRKSTPFPFLQSTSKVLSTLIIGSGGTTITTNGGSSSTSTSGNDVAFAGGGGAAFVQCLKSLGCPEAANCHDRTGGSSSMSTSGSGIAFAGTPGGGTCCCFC